MTTKVRTARTRRRLYGLLTLLGAITVAAGLTVSPGSARSPMLVASADQSTPLCTSTFGGSITVCPPVPSPTVAAPSGCPGQLVTNTCGPSTPAVGTPPVILPAPLPCPAPVQGTVCVPPSAVNASGSLPPPLPPTSNPPGTCSAPAPAGAPPNSWTSYGSTLTVSLAQTPNPNSAAANVYPLWFVPVVDRFQPCRAFRISADRVRIQRSLDAGQTWSTVLDGSSVGGGATPPSFRNIVVAAPDHLLVSETANGDAMVASSDGGTTWSLASGQPGDPANLIGEFPSTVAAGPPRAGGGVGDVYVATLACASHGRPKSSSDCDPSTSPSGHLDTGQAGQGAATDLGPVRVYASRDGGAHWQRIGEDAVDGLPSSCSVARLDLIPDPFADADHDHLWIAFANGGLVQSNCPVARTLVELRGGPAGYQSQSIPGHGYSGRAPFAVTRGPNGLRLVSGDGLLAGYSDDDGLTWTAMPQLSQLHPQVLSIAADERGNLFGVAYHQFPVNDSGDVSEFRAVVRRPTNLNGVADVELGAALPPPPGQADRSLFNYPHYDPLIPTLPSNLELLGTTTGPYSSDVQYDGQGNFYVAIGNTCYTADCSWDGKVPDSRAGVSAPKVRAAQWRLMRYTMAEPGRLPILKGLPSLSDQRQAASPHTTARCKNSGRCNLVPLQSCSIQASPYQGGPDQNGTLAFDGAELYYTRTNERSPDGDPYSALIRRLDPRGCVDNGAITVHFPKDQYDQARALTWVDWAWFGPWMSQPQYPAGRPLIDSLTYDANHDRIYFTLRSEGVPNKVRREDDGEVGDPNQLALWSVDLRSTGGVPSPSLTASLVSVTTGHCPSSNANEPGAGSRTLAFDRIGDNLATQVHPDGVIYACMPGRPAELDTSGRQVDQPCYGAYDMNGHQGAGLDVASWTMEDQSSRSGRHRALVYLDEASNTGGSSGQVSVFDLANCQEDRLYAFPANLHSAPTGSTSLACDPVTFGVGQPPVDAAQVARLEATQQVPPFTGSLRGAVLWSRVGSSLQANLIPDNGDLGLNDPFATQSCRLPVSLAYTGPFFVAPGSTAFMSARLSVIGPDAPISGQHITVTVNGTRLTDMGPTGPDGTVAFSYPAPADGLLRVDLAFDPPATDLAYYSTVGGGLITVGVPPPTLPPPAPLPPVTVPIQAVPNQVVPVPAFQFAPQPAAPAIVPAQGGQGNTVTQGQGQPAAAKEREEEQQLALALADDTPEEEAAEEARPPTEGAPGSPGDGTYSMTAASHTDQADPALALGAGVVASSFGFFMALRLRGRHAIERGARRAGQVHRRRRRR